MDPLSGAFAFATIVNLIGQFRNERQSSDRADFDDFVVWLTEQRHEEIRQLVESNRHTAIGIKALLNEQHDTLSSRLESLDNSLAMLASKMPGFSDLSAGLRPDAKLSDQAISILKQFETSGASKILKLQGVQGTVSLLYLDGTRSDNMEIPDPRFLQDDLDTLAELGLLSEDFNSRGETTYIFTRNGSELAHQYASD